MKKIAALLYEMVCARAGNYLAFFPSYSYLEQVREVFCTAHPEVETLRQDTAMDEASRADFLAQFTAAPFGCGAQEVYRGQRGTVGWPHRGRTARSHHRRHHRHPCRPRRRSRSLLPAR